MRKSRQAIRLKAVECLAVANTPSQNTPAYNKSP